MGSFKVRNLLLSKKLKLSETRLLIIDDNQIRYNEIISLFQSKNHQVQAILLDELKTFEKQLNTSWDLIIFGRAYDIKIEQAVTLIQASAEIDIPVLLLKPEDYQHSQYQSYIQKGIYDVVNLEYTERFYISLIRALSYSRTLQSKQHLLTELESAKSQAQALVEEQHKAVALIQEGIHTQANDEYLKLFGLKDENEIIGLPLLDILQPKNINDFKQRFKKISQGQFDLARFEIDTLNKNAKSENPLKIEFLPSNEEDCIQITIETHSVSQKASSQSAELSKKTVSPIINSLQQIQYALINQPANANALVLFSFAACPDNILLSNWKTAIQYLDGFKSFIKEQTNSTVYQIDMLLYAVILQAESDAILESRIHGLQALEKPQLLEIDGTTYPLSVKIGYTNIQQNNFNESNFNHILEQAYNHRLSKKDSVSEQQLSATLQDTKIELSLVEPASTAAQPLQFERNSLQLEPKSQPDPEPAPQETAVRDIQAKPIFKNAPILEQIMQSLEKGEIQLKYQQLYDKHDSSLNTYEVTSGFIFENQWKKVSNLIELDDDIELSIKLDRWILVEACKQLHNFITQYPQAKLIVNLNRHVLFHDKQFPELISKLLTIVGSRQSHPLILQFDEEDIAKSLLETQKQFAILRDHGAEISIRRFGSSISSETILKQLDVSLLTLDEKFTQKLNSDATMSQFQQTLEKYQTIKPVEMLLKNLNDMSLFANAWNVDVRFLQGEYFQKKLDHLTDVQDQ
ncbi:EAL domain-containing protein [Acinetobacter nematophilus]|uniref:EAL domain-containing protein n=1 Tax=Acinetobacter nematophilus TaxID=2994642 RepID=A0A9X3DSY1_9GAMM|nr:EAL domain-containing protein [Acinetobacter nematophilus]MCX5467929.1 EAL domain-containing protein [Acinetobacter nematophilus]